VYDRRERFAPSKYWEREYNEIVRPGTAVALLFSVRRGKQLGGINGCEGVTGVVLNVLGVVVLAEPSDPFYLDQTPDPMEIHGVDRLPRLSDGDDGGQDGESGEEEVEEGVEEEVF
jgi:hypothetical protein